MLDFIEFINLIPKESNLKIEFYKDFFKLCFNCFGRYKKLRLDYITLQYHSLPYEKYCIKYGVN